MQCIGRREPRFSLSYTLQKKGSDKMLAPRKYYGYNRESKCIASCQAEDATTKINPVEVLKALENLESVFTESMNRIASALRDMSNDANEAIIVQGTKMTGAIEDTADSIAQIPSQVVESFHELYEASIRKHDELQQWANEQAYKAVKTHSGVVRVTG